MLNVMDFRKRYQNFELQCSLQVEPGMITAVIGANGSGKSTLFKAILGLISYEGTIELFQEKNKQLNQEQLMNIGAVLPDSGFSRYLNVQDICCILSRFYPLFDQERFFSLCDQMQLPRHQRIGEFSTGMRAKLKMIIALTHQAKLLILDEPTAGLDVLARDELLGMLRDYMEEDEERSILISSHISSDLESLCDDIYMINNGSIILHEQSDVLLSSYGLIKLNEEQFAMIDKTYLLAVRKENYGYSCLCKERAYYMENYPGIVVEKGTIDHVIMMMIRGERI